MHRPPRRFSPRRRRSNRPTQTLAQPWAQWVADNLLRGASQAELVTALVSQGVPAQLAHNHVARIASSPILAAALPHARRSRQLELVCRLRSELDRAAPNPTQIERRTSPPVNDFFAHYWSTATPVVLTDYMTHWRALANWSPTYFREHFGSATIDAIVGRNADPHCDINYVRLTQAMTMASFVDRVLANPNDGDIYLIARNRNLARSELRSLLDDLAPAAYLNPEHIASSSALWFGPGGTQTRLHHDTSGILLCQVYGRKRVRLVAPHQTALITDARGFYCNRDAESDSAMADVLVKETVLGPGDALFIPPCWWHHVRALEVSISVALNNFTRPNHFAWYTPGARG